MEIFPLLFLALAKLCEQPCLYTEVDISEYKNDKWDPRT